MSIPAPLSRKRTAAWAWAKDCHGWPLRVHLVADFRARTTRIFSSSGDRTMLRFIVGFASAFVLLSSTTVLAQSPATSEAPAAPAAQPNDYSKPETWLCRPNRKDSCAVDLSTTIVAANGKFKKESFKAAKNAPIDCFYVYPTVSLDQGGNSDMTAGPEEHGVILQQFARFSSVCRVYAPLYRQVTLTALRSIIGGKPMPVDRQLGYNDVLEAWNYYLKNDNAG